jgi:hypothetical protein
MKFYYYFFNVIGGCGLLLQIVGFLYKTTPSPANNQSHTIYGSAIPKNTHSTNEEKTLAECDDGPDVIRTHDLPVISRAHHRAMLRAQKFAGNLPYLLLHQSFYRL